MTVALAEEENNGERGIGNNGKKPLLSTNVKYPQRVRETLSNEMKNLDEEVERGLGQMPTSDKYGKYSSPDRGSRNEEQKQLDKDRNSYNQKGSKMGNSGGKEGKGGLGRIEDTEGYGDWEDLEDSRSYGCRCCCCCCYGMGGY